MIKKIFLLFLIIFVVYLLGLFLYAEKTAKIGEELGFGEFNKTIFKVKGRIDELSEMKPESMKDKATEVLDKTTELLQTGKGYVDKARSTAQDIEETYNDVKTQIDQTTKNLQEIGEKINEAKNTVDNVKNIFNN